MTAKCTWLNRRELSFGAVFDRLGCCGSALLDAIVSENVYKANEVDFSMRWSRVDGVELVVEVDIG